MTNTANPFEMPVEIRSGNQRRLLVAASIVAGIAYPFADGRFGMVADVGVKGICVGLLAVAAVLAIGTRHKWLAAIMAAGAIGDMLLEVPGAFFIGAGAFAVGHVMAMVFYTRYRREGLSVADQLIAAGLIGFGLAMPRLVMPAEAPVGALMLYSVLLCGMAAAAWISRFPRRWTAAGALLFVVSDTFLVMRIGGTLVGGALVHGLIVWYSYYVGQLMIFVGVSQQVFPSAGRGAV